MNKHVIKIIFILILVPDKSFAREKDSIQQGTDFDSITIEQIQQVEDWINNRPMKVLGYKTPNEKYQEYTLLESVAI